jgi:hypothetical protein
MMGMTDGVTTGDVCRKCLDACRFYRSKKTLPVINGNLAANRSVLACQSPDVRKEAGDRVRTPLILLVERACFPLSWGLELRVMGMLQGLPVHLLAEGQQRNVGPFFD